MIKECRDSCEVCLPPNITQKLFTLQLRNWFEWNLMGKDLLSVVERWLKNVVIICWWQWRWRNEDGFYNNVLPGPWKVQFLKQCFIEQVEVWNYSTKMHELLCSDYHEASNT